MREKLKTLGILLLAACWLPHLLLVFSRAGGEVPDRPPSPRQGTEARLLKATHRLSLVFLNPLRAGDLQTWLGRGSWLDTGMVAEEDASVARVPVAMVFAASSAHEAPAADWRFTQRVARSPRAPCRA